MKLQNQTLAYLSISILFIISVWGTIFYFNMLDEIHHSIDEGLSNFKSLIIQKAEKDSTLLGAAALEKGNYSATPVDQRTALSTYDRYSDTLIFIPAEDEYAPMRMLTTAFENKGRYYELKVISSKVEEDELIESLFWSVIGLYIVLIISIITINAVVLKRLWKPFYHLLRQLQRFRVDRNDPLPDVRTSTSEFVQLKEAATLLASHAVEAFRNQKQFTENAAHELQTPLAIAINNLELLLEKGTLSSQDADSVTQTLGIISRMVQLNRSLVLLSKIENKQFIHTEELSVNQLITQVLEDLQEFIAYKEITIEFDAAEDFTIQADPTLARVLISNLIRNAIFHNSSSGRVTIGVSGTTLSISNTAVQSALDASAIFKRFYKDPKKSKSTGLGLAIVKAICEVYHYRVSYQFDGMHRFEVRFA